MIDPGTEYPTIRAKGEAVLEIRAGHPADAAALRGLAVRYSHPHGGGMDSVGFQL